MNITIEKGKHYEENINRCYSMIVQLYKKEICKEQKPKENEKQAV